MKICDIATFNVNGKIERYYHSDIGLDKFIELFHDTLEKSGCIQFEKQSELKSKTARGNKTEVIKHVFCRRYTSDKDEFHDGYTLLFLEQIDLVYDGNWNKISNGKSKFYVYKIREATADELSAKNEALAKRCNFSIDNVNLTYIATLKVSSNTGLHTNVDGWKSSKFKTFEEAKAFIEKMRKAWHLQMTLNGLSNNIEHDTPNTLTVFKPKCAKKYISKFHFYIESKMSYNNEND